MVPNSIALKNNRRTPRPDLHCFLSYGGRQIISDKMQVVMTTRDIHFMVPRFAAIGADAIVFHSQTIASLVDECPKFDARAAVVGDDIVPDQMMRVALAD